MELKFIFSIIVLLHLRICVSGSSVGVEDCIEIVQWYPEGAKGFAEDATQEELEVAIGSITEAFWNQLYEYGVDLFNWSQDESRITSDMKQCYEIRKDPAFIHQYQNYINSDQYQQFENLGVENCMDFVKLNLVEAKGFGEEDAKQEDLEVAISSISKAFWNSNITNPNFIYNQSVVESHITSELTQCYEIRKNAEFIRQYQAEKISRYPLQVWYSSWYIGVQWIPVVFGLIGNIALIAIFRKKDLKLRFNSLMLTLAVFDMIYLCTQIAESMVKYFEEGETTLEHVDKIFVDKVFSNTAFSLSTFTAIAISIERYCKVCHNINTKKVPLSAVIITIMITATLSNVQWMVPSMKDIPHYIKEFDTVIWGIAIERKTLLTLYIVSAVLYIIPAIVIAALNVAIFRQLKRLLQADTYSSANNEIKKVLFQIGLTNLIAIIFVGSQVAYAIWVCLAIGLRSNENTNKFYTNPLEWETLYKFWAYIGPIMIMCRLLNCSLNFYAYLLLRYRNQRAETRRRQKRQQDREMVNLNPTKKTDESNLETA